MDDNPKKSFFDSFRINDRLSCSRAIRNGGIAAMISAGVTALFAGIGSFVTSSNKSLAYFLDPWLFLDVAFLIVLGIFVFRKSRIASTLLVIYFAISKAMFWYDTGKPQGLFVSIIFFLYYVTAMIATYIWHSSYSDDSTTLVAQQDAEGTK